MKIILFLSLLIFTACANPAFTQSNYFSRICRLNADISSKYPEYGLPVKIGKTEDEKFLENISFFKSAAPVRYQNVWRNEKLNVNSYAKQRQNFDFQPGLGLSTVDSSTFYLLRLNPSYTVDQRSTSGSGSVFYSQIDLPLRYSTKKVAFRKQDYDNAAQVLSALNLAYGYNDKKVNLDAGFQQIDNAQLGFGSIMYQYSNSPSYEARRNGINVNATFPRYAITSNLLLSDLTRGGVIGVGANFFPLELLRDDRTGEIKIPVLKNFVAGVNFAGDFNENAGITKINYSIDTSQGPNNIRYIVTGKEDAGAINIVNLFAGAKLFGDENHVLLYADYSKIFKFGSNLAAGLNAIVESDDISFTANIQRRFQSGKYLPTYFDAFYETDRYSLVTSENNATVPEFHSKAAALDTVRELKGSTYGEAVLTVGKVLSLTGAYQKLDINEYGGEIFLAASVNNATGYQYKYAEGYFELLAGYYKKGIRESGDIFTFNENAIFFGQASYVLSQMFTLSLTYRQTFAAIRDSNGNPIGYEPQKSFQPELKINLGL